MYIDDKGIGFNADRNKTIEDIKSFQQWQTVEKRIEYDKIKRFRRNK